MEVTILASRPTIRAGERVDFTITATNLGAETVWTNPSVIRTGSWDFVVRNASGEQVRVDDRCEMGCPSGGLLAQAIAPATSTSLTIAWDGRVRDQLAAITDAPRGRYEIEATVRWADREKTENAPGPHTFTGAARTSVVVTSKVAPRPMSRETPMVGADRAPHDAKTGTYVWREYKETQAEISRLSTLLTEKNREVVAQLGRNDTPYALAVLNPIREQLQRARKREEHLLCWDRPVIPRPREMFERMGIRFDRRRVDRRWVDAYVTAKVADGALNKHDAARLRFILSKSGRGVMNPSSRGASAINQRIAKALRCFGLDGPPRTRMIPPGELSPTRVRPKPTKIRY